MIPPHCDTCRCLHAPGPSVTAFVASAPVTCYPGDRARSRDLYAAYIWFCKGNRFDPFGPKRFSQELMALGFRRFRSDGAWFAGIGLRSF